LLNHASIKILEMNKKEENYIIQLLSGDEQTVNKAFEEIKVEGTVTLLPSLIGILNETSDSGLKKQIYNLLCELKQIGCVPILVEAITNAKYSAIQDTLIRSCWENGLDYCSYLPEFVDIVIEGEFINAFEAFTVIENMEGTFENKMLREIISKLEASVENSSIEKRSLIADIIKMFK